MLFGLLWSLVPAIASAMVASSRNQSVGLALLVGLILGWVGLLLVIFLFKPEVTSTVRTMADAAQRATVSPPPGASRDTRSRLLELDRLKQEGLVTPTEYESRRARILEEI